LSRTLVGVRITAVKRLGKRPRSSGSSRAPRDGKATPLAEATAAAPGPTGDAAAYAALPVKADEFSGCDDDPLAWDADGWQDIDAPR